MTFRILATTVNIPVSSYVEQVFLPTSYCWRQGIGLWDLFADLEHWIVKRGHWVLTHDDIRGAFDNVDVHQLLHDFRATIVDPRYCALIENLVRGHPTEFRELGQDQGSSLSATGMNLTLQLHRDVPLQLGYEQPRDKRYGDNLIGFALTEAEVLETRAQSEQLLRQIGLELKTKPEAIDLRSGQRLSLLGLELYARGGEIGFAIPQEAWQHFEKRLEETAEAADPPDAARRLVEGWLRAYGPALDGDRQALIAEIRGRAAKQGYREIPSECLRRTIQSGHNQWLAHRERRQRRLPTYS